MSSSSLPPCPPALISALLSHLVPELNVPLPPDLLSRPLHQRHTFLPPTLDDPIGHFVHREIDVEIVEEALNGIGRLMGEGEHPSLTPAYRLTDAGQTLQARVWLYSSPAPSPPPSLALFFVYEGDANGWRYHDLQLADCASTSEAEWTVDLDSAISAAEDARKRADASAGSSSSSEAAQNGEGDGVVADSEDFWSGFSDDEGEGQDVQPTASTSQLPSTQQPEIPSPNEDEPTTPPPHVQYPPVSSHIKRPSMPSSVHSNFSSTSLDDGDGGYWSQYSGVDDGLAPPSNPTSPRPTNTMAEGQEAWGTGGETPISWTPNPVDQSGGDAGGYFLPSDADDQDEDAPEGYYASGGAGGRARGRTITGDSERGTYPTFPVPPFKGATPAGSPDIPRTMSGFVQAQLDAHAQAVAQGSDEGSTPSPPHQQQSRLGATIPAPAPFTKPTSPPKVVNGFVAAAQGEAGAGESVGSRREVLKGALTSLLAMYRLGGGGGERAEEEWLEVAMEVGAEGLKRRRKAE